MKTKITGTYKSHSIKKGKPLQLAIYHIFNSYKKPRSPKFPNFLEHHKPFPSNKRGAHRAGCVNRNTYKPIVHYMKKLNAKAQMICCQTITFLRREVLILLPMKIFDFLAP